MIRWLLGASVRRAPRRLVLAILGVAFPVAMLAATSLGAVWTSTSPWTPPPAP